MKQKVINVTYRKDSQTFPKWMKFEVTLLNEDGTQDTIPAYGKDLQDALSRVVHDKVVDEVHNTVVKIPWWGWAITWFAYLVGLVYIVRHTQDHWYFGGGLLLPMIVITLLNRWSIEQNRDRINKK